MRKSYRIYGTISGTFFLLIAVVMLYVLWLLLTTIKRAGNLLSNQLKQERDVLIFLVVVIIISYFFGSVFNFIYGEYHIMFGLVFRWILYPVAAILIEIPNMLLIYIIHWRTYKDRPMIEEVFEQDETTDQYEKMTVESEVNTLESSDHSQFLNQNDKTYEEKKSNRPASGFIDLIINENTVKSERQLFLSRSMASENLSDNSSMLNQKQFKALNEENDDLPHF